MSPWLGGKSCAAWLKDSYPWVQAFSSKLGYGILYWGLAFCSILEQNPVSFSSLPHCLSQLFGCLTASPSVSVGSKFPDTLRPWMPLHYPRRKQFLSLSSTSPFRTSSSPQQILVHHRRSQKSPISSSFYYLSYKNSQNTDLVIW